METPGSVKHVELGLFEEAGEEIQPVTDYNMRYSPIFETGATTATFTKVERIDLATGQASGPSYLINLEALKLAANLLCT